MKHRAVVYCVGAVLLVVAVVCSVYLFDGIKKAEASETKEPTKLFIIWTSGDRDVALKTVFMYTYYSKKNKWWDEVKLVVWGPSSLLLSVDKELQDYIRKMKEEGVILEACKACADMYGVSDKLAAMDIDVKYMGKPVSDMLKSGWASMTF